MSEIKVGDRVTASLRPGVGVVMAADNGWAWVRWPEEPCPLTQNTTDLTLVPPKIAEPPVGSVVWDGDVPWYHFFAEGTRTWFAHGHDDRIWSDFPDTVVRATPPEASHD